MSDSQAISTAQGSGLDQQVAALQRQVFLLLVALIVVTATVVFYLFYQSHIEGNDLAENRPRAIQMIQTFERNQLAIQNFYKEMVNYGDAHPGFQQAVLRKYGLVPKGPTTAPIQ